MVSLAIFSCLLTRCRYGLDLMKGTVRDNLKAGVMEPVISKLKSLKAATEAAIALLRIEYVIFTFSFLLTR